MATLCRPAVSVPEHVVTMQQTLGPERTMRADHPQLQLALRLMENTGVRKRHLLRPIEETPRQDVPDRVLVEESTRAG